MLDAADFGERLLVRFVGPMDRKAAENAVRQARSQAEAALMRAARISAAAGLDFNVPPGFQVDVSGIVKVIPWAGIACSLQSPNGFWPCRRGRTS